MLGSSQQTIDLPLTLTVNPQTYKARREFRKSIDFVRLKRLVAVYLSLKGISIGQKCFNMAIAGRGKFVSSDRFRRVFSPNFPEEDCTTNTCFPSSHFVINVRLVEVNL